MSIFQYTSRSAEQIEQDLRNALVSELPEIKDYDNDVLVRGLRIWAGIAELLHYYIDNVARESNPTSARIFENLVRIARGVDIRIQSSIPFEVDVTFTISVSHASNIIIQKDTVISTADNQVRYMTTKVATIVAGQTSVIVQAKQMVKVDNQLLGTTTGLAFQTLLMPSNVVDMAITIAIGAEQYNPQETFYRSLPSSPHFIPTINTNGELDILLGDGINGKLPTANQNISTTYYQTLGSGGGVNVGDLSTIITNLTLPTGITITVINALQSRGGRDRESVASLKKRIAFWNRTVETGISLQTYKDLAELHTGVEKAGARYESGNTVQLFIIPSEGGIASVSLINEVTAYMADKIIIGTLINVQTAGVVLTVLEIDLYLSSNSIKVNIENDVKNALVSFGSLSNQEIGGQMLSGKLSQIVCNVDGVDDCIITNFSFIPFARPTNTILELDWTVNILAGSTSGSFWRILFTTTTSFQLLKNDVFVGNFNVGVSVIQPEIEFTINSNYNSGSAWEFYSYEYLGDRNGLYQLQESEIFQINNNFISLTSIGGV